MDASQNLMEASQGIPMDIFEHNKDNFLKNMDRSVGFGLASTSKKKVYINIEKED